MKSAARDTCMQSIQELLHSAAAKPRHTPADDAEAMQLSVATLQPRVLTMPQLDALAQIQDAMTSMATLQAAINQLATLHALPVRRVGLTELGMLHTEIEALLWDSARTAELLKRGGIPAEVRPLAPSPVVVEALHQATDGRIAA